MRSNRRAEEPKFLSGWKEIANYLGKGVRTVQRYERYMGFPVRRPAGKPRGAVIGTRAELDTWVAASPIRDEFRLAMPASGGESGRASMAGALEEMRRLRQQMRGLSDELGKMAVVLRNTLETLEVDLANSRRDHPLPIAAMYGDKEKIDLVYQMLTTLPAREKRKAS